MGPHCAFFAFRIYRHQTTGAPLQPAAAPVQHHQRAPLQPAAARHQTVNPPQEPATDRHQATGGRVWPVA